MCRAQGNIYKRHVFHPDEVQTTLPADEQARTSNKSMRAIKYRYGEADRHRPCRQTGGQNILYKVARYR